VRFGGYTNAGVLVNDANGNITSNTTVLGQVAANTTAIGTLQTQTTNNTTAIGVLQTQTSANSSAIGTLQGQAAQLFDLADINRRDIQRANEGVAMALAMESPQLPPGTTFGVAGGIGYYNHRTAATASVAARIGNHAAFTAGMGVGVDTGEVGARAGIQAAW
jgi:hypothetical protein